MNELKAGLLVTGVFISGLYITHSSDKARNEALQKASVTVATAPLAPSTLERTAAETLSLCGNAYAAERGNDTLGNRTWAQYLRECKGIAEKQLAAAPPVSTEKWTNGDELNDRLPRNIKFNLGDIVCHKTKPKFPFVVYDIRPRWNKEGNGPNDNLYTYHVSYFDKNDEYKNRTFFEIELVKCEP
jgi:hypothetical protein